MSGTLICGKMIRLAMPVALAFAAPAFAQQQHPQVTVEGPAPAPAASQPPPQPPATMVVEPVAMMIAACDQNGDAIVSRAEMSACIARSFAGVDTAHTGTIGYIVYSDWALKWLGDRNALPSPFEVDADGDNRITLAELDRRLDTIFTRLDRDQNGVLSRAELLTIRSNPAGGQPGGPQKGKRRCGGKPDGQ